MAKFPTSPSLDEFLADQDDDFWVGVCVDLDEDRGVEREKHEQVIHRFCARGDAVFKRRSLHSSIRMAVYHRDAGKCAYCGLILGRDAFTVDHIYPVALGGADDIDNLTVACRPCNSSNGTRLIESETAR